MQQSGHEGPHKKTGVAAATQASTSATPQQTPARNAAGSRSGTLKRVAFKDEQTVHLDDGASSVRCVQVLLEGDSKLSRMAKISK